MLRDTAMQAGEIDGMLADILAGLLEPEGGSDNARLGLAIGMGLLGAVLYWLIDRLEAKVCPWERVWSPKGTGGNRRKAPGPAVGYREGGR